MEFVEIPAMMVEQLVDVQLVTGSMVVGVICVDGGPSYPCRCC